MIATTPGILAREISRGIMESKVTPDNVELVMVIIYTKQPDGTALTGVGTAGTFDFTAEHERKVLQWAIQSLAQ